MDFNSTTFIEQIAKKDFDLNSFVQLAIINERARNEIVCQMVTNSAIMVYYHCYYVVENASRERPDLFYSDWNKIAELLHHNNSYHRDFALEIIGNLTCVDQENRFLELKDEYFSILNDEKFMTGNCCVKNLLKIYRHKPDHREEIIQILLDIDNRCNFSEKQKGVLKADILDIFDELYGDGIERDRINEFIMSQAYCVSPKTRNKAKGLVKKYGL
jgi:hypothetical protein